MKPIIMVVINHTKDKYTIAKEYINMVHDLGAIPILCATVSIEDINDLLSIVDGILLTGGGDISGDFFDEITDYRATDIMLERDQFEIEIIKKAMHYDLPILGICRGAQVINVALGGKVVQHIDNHNYTDKNYIAHNANIIKNTNLSPIFNCDYIKVNSIHHQVIDKNFLGNNVKIFCISDDLMVEGVYVTNKKFVVGVQWHIEFLYNIYSEQKRLMEEFIFNCKN